MVGRVLARLARVRDLDQLERRLVHRRLELLVPIPVAVGLLCEDAPLQQKPLNDRPDVEALELGVADTEGHVLEVAEHRQIAVTVHGHTPFLGRRTTGARNLDPFMPGPPFGVDYTHAYETSRLAGRSRVTGADAVSPALLHLKGVEHRVLDPLPPPGAGNVELTVSCLDHGLVGILAVLGLSRHWQRQHREWRGEERGYHKS